jgi:hypothetical protein
MASVGKIAQLKQLLLGMERDLGIDNLGAVQKNIVYVATLLSEKDGNFETGEMRKHELLEGVSRSAFFRALNDVVNAGYLSHFNGTQRSAYTLADKLK